MDSLNHTKEIVFLSMATVLGGHVGVKDWNVHAAVCDGRLLHPKALK
jgi:hypothetical protein